MVYCVAPPPLSRPGVRAVSPVLLAVMTRTVIALVVLVTLVTLVTAEALVAGEVVVDGVVPGVGGPLGVVVYYLGVGWGVVCDQFTGHHPASAEHHPALFEHHLEIVGHHLGTIGHHLNSIWTQASNTVDA